MQPPRRKRIFIGSADLRLAVVSPFVDRSHGTERALAELLERLAHRYGCQIHLFSQRVEGVSLDATNRGGAESGAIIWHKVPSLPGPHVAQFLAWLVLNNLVLTSKRFFGTYSFDLLLSPGINALHADLVIVHALFHRLQELSRREQAAMSVNPRALRDLHRRLYYSLLTLLERHVYSDRRVSLAAVSERTAALLVRYFGRSDVRVIPNGVDTAQFCPSARLERRESARVRRSLRDSDLVLLLIGNDWQNKGLSTILSAMAACPDLPFRLLVVGSDANERFYERAKSLGVYERCMWEHPQPDVMDLYAAADVYVSPSREDAFALPPLEAMACGLPVITSINNGGSQIITEGTDGFILADADDSVALANLLRRLAMQPDLRSRVGENAARTAQQYSWDRNAAAVWEFIQEEHARKRSISTTQASLRARSTAVK
jgi:glycosyltransferase involved in cell wall biosynthesis